mgnify:CR=1 FL=1
MAKLDFYRQQSTPQSGGGPGPVARAVPNDVGANVLDAGIRIGGQAVQYVAQRQEDAAAIDASSRVMAAHRHWIEREQQIREEALVSGELDGVTERAAKEYEQFVTLEVARARTPASRQWMQERLGQLGLSLFERSTTWEAGAKVERDVGLADKALGDAQVVVDADPSQFGAALETLKLPFARLPADKREAAWNKARGDVAEYAARRGAEANPRAILQALDAEPGRASVDYVNALDADGRVRVRVAAEGRIRELEAEARARRAEARDTLSMRIQNQTAQIEAGLGVPNPITRGEFAAAGLSAGDYAGYQGLVQQGADYQALWRLPESDIRALVAGRDPAKEPGSAVEAGFAGRFRLNQQLRSRAADVLQAREADPGAYLYQYSPGVAAAYDAIGQATTPQAAAAAAQNYARVAASESNRLGIRNRAILPQAYADTIVSDFEQQEQGGEPAALRIIGERAKWGRYWPQVMRQIGPKLPGTAAVIGTGMRPQPAARLAEFGRLKDEDLAKLLPSGTAVRDVRDAVAGELEDFRATIAGQPGEPQTYGMLSDAAYRLAVAHMAEGRSATDAATLAASEVVNERYQFVEARGSQIRVPVGQPTPEVQAGLRAVWYRDVAALGYPRLDEARWQTLPDDSGVALVHQGNVVRRRDGTPVTYGWQTIRNRAATVGEDARQLDRDLRDPARGRLP